MVVMPSPPIRFLAQVSEKYRRRCVCSRDCNTGGGNGGSVAFDQRNTLASIKDDALGMSEKPDYITLKGAVTYVRHDNEPWYAACPNAGCNKKVV